MRVSDGMLNSVGFIAEVLSEDGDPASVDPIGTGVFVRIPSKRVPSLYFRYFVTARHVVDGLHGRKSRIVINTKDGGVTELAVPRFPIAPHQEIIWVRHSDASVDLAATPFMTTPQYDIVDIPESIFVTPDRINQLGCGIGDETYTIGLFTPALGVKRNQPILRIGNIAMMPGDPVQVEGKMSDVYLIEARSIGGISGSPVFVHRTTQSGTTFHQKSFFLGVTHGHWDVRESDLNSPAVVHDRQRGVNLGIAVVVPAHKILELFDHPDLAVPRQLLEDRHLSSIPRQPDANAG